MKTFFIIFMYMEPNLNNIQNIAHQLNGLEVNNIRVHDVSVFQGDLEEDSHRIVLSVYDGNTDGWTINQTDQLFQAVYDKVVSITGDPQFDVKFTIAKYEITAGLNGVQVNMLDARTNLLPAYIRHHFILPIPLKEIPQLINIDYFVLPEESVGMIQDIIRSFNSQKNVPQRYENLLRLLKRGTINIKMDVDNHPLRGEPMRARYSLPENSKMVFGVDKVNHYKIVGKLDLGTEGSFNIEILEDEQTLKDRFEESAKSGGAQHNMINGCYRTFEKMLATHKLKFQQESYQVCNLMRIETVFGTITNNGDGGFKLK